MKRKFIWLLILICSFLFFSHSVTSADFFPNLKLPFPAGEKWTVTQGYNSSYSHNSGNSIYAIDFSLPGEQDYEKPILAVDGGIAHLKENSKINLITGEKEYYDYGKYIEIDHGNYVSLYAHLLDFAVEEGQQVKQGEVIGYCDSTGNSSGSHLHFALFKKEIIKEKDEETGQEKEIVKYIPVKPEPMSGYGEGQSKGPFVANNQYVSDNQLAENNQSSQSPSPQPQPQPSSPPLPPPPVGLTGGNDNLSFWDKIVFYWNGFVANVKEIFGGSTGEVQVAKPLTQTEVQQQTNNGSASSPSAGNNNNDNNKPEENSSPPLEPFIVSYF